MQRGRHVLGESSIVIAVSGDAYKQCVWSAPDGALDTIAPDGKNLGSAPLSFRRVGAGSGVGKPHLKFPGIIFPAHVDNSHVAGAEVVRHLLKVRRYAACIFRSGLERKM